MNQVSYLEAMEKLSKPDQEIILQKLLSLLDDQSMDIGGLLHEKAEQSIETPACPHCTSQKTIRRGNYKKIPRYSCKECGRFWMATHGTALEGLKKKHLWGKYISAFLQRKSLRKAAIQVGISLGTSFNWRHLILTTLAQLLPLNKNGVIECDSMELKYLEKGKNNTPKIPQDDGEYTPIFRPKKITFLLGASRNCGSVISSILALDTPPTEKLSNQLECISNINSKLVLTKSLRSKTKKLDRLVYWQGKSKKIDPLLQTKRVQKKCSGVIDFLEPFRGVSTKYLFSYLCWFNYFDHYSNQFITQKKIFSECLKSYGIRTLFKKIKFFGTNIITVSSHISPIYTKPNSILDPYD